MAMYSGFGAPPAYSSYSSSNSDPCLSALGGGLMLLGAGAFLVGIFLPPVMADIAAGYILSGLCAFVMGAVLSSAADKNVDCDKACNTLLNLWCLCQILSIFANASSHNSHHSYDVGGFSWGGSSRMHH